MKKRLLMVCLFTGMLCAVIAQNVGIGEPSPGSKLSVQGNSAIGADYSTTVAPTNGLLIEGITGVGTSTVDTNAILNVVSTSKGLLIPKLTTVAMNAMVNPAKGMMIFNNDSANFYYYTGSAWVCNSAPNGTAGGDLSGHYPSPTVAKINGTTLGSTTATSGNLLIGSGSQWVSQPVSGDVTISSTGATTIGANKVTNADIRQSSGLSVIGNSGTSTANVADITGTAGLPLRVNTAGTSLGFGTIDGNAFGSQTANYVWAAPNGSSGIPTFRALVGADLPSGSGNYIENQTSQQSSSNYNISGNGTIGGTLTLAPITSGSVLFAGTGGLVSQSNANLFWNSTNNELGIGTNSFDGTNPQKLLVSAGTTTSVNVISGNGSINNYLQLNIQNTSSGTSASSDVVATANNGSETRNYIDMGINGSGNTAANWGNADDAYLYTHGGNLNIGTDTTGMSIIFKTGGGAAGNENMRILASNGYLGVNNTNPGYPVDVTGDVNSSTGYRISGTAASGNYLRGNGTKFVSSTIQAGDIPSLATSYIQNQTSQQASSNFNISANGVIGGTLSLTPMTTGSVLFAGASGVVSQDNSNIFWDDTHDRLGIGTASPSNSLSLTGQSAQTIWMERETTNNKAGNTLTIQSGGATSGASKKAGGDLQLSSGTSTGNGTSNIIFYTYPGTAGNTTDNTQTEAMRINGSQYLGVNNSNPQYPVDVTGDVNSSTGYTIGGAAASGNYLRGNGTQFISSGIQAADIPTGSGNYIQNGTSQQSSSNYNISGNGTIGGTLSLTPMTTGSLLFAGASGVVSQDNSNIYWNDATGELGVGTNSFNGANPEKLLVNAGTTSSVTAICGKGSINNYFQLNIQNTNGGTGVSSDVVATANNGSETGYYIDMGINGGGNTSANWGNADDAYMYTHGGNLNIGTDSAAMSILFKTGGGASGNENMRINGSTGYVGIGATNPTSMLSVGASSQFQVNSSGNIVKLNNVTTNFPSSQGGANTYLTNDGSGNLTWSTTTGSIYGTVNTQNNVSSYTAAANDFLIFVTGTTATTITIPNPAAGNTGRIIVVRNSTNQNVTIQTTSGSYMLTHQTQNTTAQATLVVGKGGGTDAEGDMAGTRLMSTGSYWVAW